MSDGILLVQATHQHQTERSGCAPECGQPKKMEHAAPLSAIAFTQGEILQHASKKHTDRMIPACIVASTLSHPHIHTERELEKGSHESGLH